MFWSSALLSLPLYFPVYCSESLIYLVTIPIYGSDRIGLFYQVCAVPRGFNFGFGRVATLVCHLSNTIIIMHSCFTDTAVDPYLSTSSDSSSYNTMCHPRPSRGNYTIWESLIMPYGCTRWTTTINFYPTIYTTIIIHCKLRRDYTRSLPKYRYMSIAHLLLNVYLFNIHQLFWRITSIARLLQYRHEQDV
jgi:hypothetical protein